MTSGPIWQGCDDDGDSEECGQRDPVRVRPDHNEARERQQPEIDGHQYIGQVRQLLPCAELLCDRGLGKLDPHAVSRTSCRHHYHVPFG